MKIYYIINGRIPTEKANGYQISQMIQAFGENGTEVILLRPRRVLSAGLQAFRNNLKDFYHLRKEPKTVDIWSFDFQYFFHHLSPIFDKLQFISNLLHSISFVLGLIRYFRSVDLEAESLVYLRDINILSWLWPFLRRSLKENIILELHYLPDRPARRDRYLRILKKAKAVICITNKMKEDLTSQYYPQSKIWVEHDGVDLDTFKINKTIRECREELGYPRNRDIVGYVGNFHTNGQEKGIDDLIRASKSILKVRPETYFYFVGGPLDRVPKYKNLIRDLQVPEKNFVFFDRRPVAQVPVSMGACDVLVIPLPWNKYFAYYMSPMKLFEYMASRRCIVATNVESLKEILIHDRNALLAEHSNTEDLAEKIASALGDRQLRERIAVQAFKDVQYHTWNLRAGRILLFIRSLSRQEHI